MEKNITQVVHPISGQTIILNDFFDMVERSIEYSESINERAKTEPPAPEATAEERRRIRERLLDKKDESPEEIMRRRRMQ